MILSRLPCATHGAEAMHRYGKCVQCEGLPEQQRTAAPTKRIHRVKTARMPTGGRPRAVDLTPRERQISELVASGKTQADIARELNLTRAAIASTVQRAMQRIGVTHAYELVRYIRQGKSAAQERVDRQRRWYDMGVAT